MVVVVMAATESSPSPSPSTVVEGEAAAPPELMAAIK